MGRDGVREKRGDFSLGWRVGTVRERILRATRQSRGRKGFAIRISGATFRIRGTIMYVEKKKLAGIRQLRRVVIRAGFKPATF